MITNEIYFFKNQSSVSTSGPLYNVNDGTLILQVDGNVSNLELLVLGNTDLVDNNFVTLKTINASNYNMSDKITSTGIYWIDINGIRKIKLSLNKITGSVSVKAITKRGLTTDLVARAMAANSASGGITLDDVEAITGELANLNTEDKSNLVNAINEVASSSLSAYYAEGDTYSTFVTEENQLIFKAWFDEYIKTGIAPNFEIKTKVRTDSYQYHNFRLLSVYDWYNSRIYMNFVSSGQSDNEIYMVVLAIDHSGNEFTEFITDNDNSYLEAKKYILPTASLPDMSNYLSKTNTTSYTPTGDYNPATKKYVDDSINALPSSAGSTPIYNFAYDESVEFYCGYNNINYVVSTNEKNVNRASEIINDMYANEFGTAIINFYNKNSAKAFSYMCTMQFGSIHNKSTSFTFMAFNKKQHLYTQTYDFDNFRLDINGTWTDNVFTANEIICQGIAIEFSGGIASVDYVNDSISSAITTSLEASY